MADKGNERALTFTSVTELTGEAEHERVKELEIIFGSYEEIDPHALRRCSNLQKLTVINCRLVCAPCVALRAVRESLVHLCLSAQHISRMEPLDLPNLRALYLQQNRIERIEGLENCRRLRVLWLYGNCIKRVENLSQCTDLRELWLQDNALQSLSATDRDTAVEELVNLETLHVAKNRIRSIDELQALRKLSNLRSLSFSDDHFGTNPVVRHPEYRVVAIATLRQMQLLDGVAIDAAERTGAVDQFFTEAMTFNDTIAELTLRYEQDLRDIQTRKQRGESNAKMLQRELIEALNEVEQSVVRGTQELEQEKLRHVRLREQHVALTVGAIDRLRHEYQQQLDEMLADELRALDDEELYYEVQEQEAEAAHGLALTVATLQCAFPTKIACETLPEHAPDFRHVLSHFEQDGGKHDKPVQVLQIIRFFHEDLNRGFDDAVASPEKPPAEGLMTYLYCIVNEDEAMSILQHGFTKSQDQWIALFSDPTQALSYSQGRPGAFCEEEGDSTTQEQARPRIHSHLLLLCQTFVVRVSEVTIGDVTMAQMGSLASIVSLATAAAPDSAQVGTFVHTHLQTDRSEGDLYITRRDMQVACVVPQFIVLCSQRLTRLPEAPVKASTINAVSTESGRGPEQLLNEFSNAIDGELHRYHDRVWRELDPSAWVQKQRFQQEVEGLDREAVQLKQRVAEEKKIQRKIVKSARQRK